MSDEEYRAAIIDKLDRWGMYLFLLLVTLATMTVFSQLYHWFYSILT